MILYSKERFFTDCAAMCNITLIAGSHVKHEVTSNRLVAKVKATTKVRSLHLTHALTPLLRSKKDFHFLHSIGFNLANTLS